MRNQNSFIKSILREVQIKENNTFKNEMLSYTFLKRRQKECMAWKHSTQNLTNDTY